MSNNMTTTLKGFRVEDITFKNARRQCEIENEIDKTEEEETQEPLETAENADISENSEQENMEVGTDE